MSIRKKLRKTLEAGEQSSLPQYGLKEIISTLAGSLREFGKPAWATFSSPGRLCLSAQSHS